MTDEQLLAPEPRHEKVGQLVRDFIERSHYSHASVDDDLSELVLERYIEALDSNRMYLLASDVEAFRKFRYQLDDMVDHEPLNPVFDMFDVYRTRARQTNRICPRPAGTEPDFTIDESYTFDRSEMPWATTTEELDEIWRMRVKNDALNLVLPRKSGRISRKFWRNATTASSNEWTRSRTTMCSRPS